MASINFAVAAGLALLGGPLLFYRGFRSYRTLRLIEDTPTAKIRSMAMGLAEVTGAATSRSRLEAPFSGRECAYWEVDIATKTGRRESWTVIHRNQSHQPFYLEDDTGVALVYPAGASCTMHFPKEEVCAGLMLPQVYADYIQEQGGLGLMLGRLGALRFRERAVEPGQRVYVLGSAFPRSQAVSLSDEDALQATGTGDAAPSRLRTMDERTVAVIRRGENESTFIISQDGELGVKVGLGWKTFVGLVGGPLAALAGLWYWLEALRMGALP